MRTSPSLIVLLIVPTLCLFLLINFWQLGIRSPVAYLLGLIALYTPAIILLRVVLRRSQSRGAYADVTLIINDAGITQQTVLGSTFVAWRNLLAVQESVGLFLFYVTSQSAITLPVRVVEREGALSDLRAMIANSHAGKASLAAS